MHAHTPSIPFRLGAEFDAVIEQLAKPKTTSCGLSTSLGLTGETQRLISMFCITLRMQTAFQLFKNEFYNPDTF